MNELVHKQNKNNLFQRLHFHSSNMLVRKLRYGAIYEHISSTFSTGFADVNFL